MNILLTLNVDFHFAGQSCIVNKQIRYKYSKYTLISYLLGHMKLS